MSSVATWLASHELSPIEVDCATTVMLKIIDGKCKMSGVEKIVMRELYRAVRHLPGKFFDEDMHSFIEHAESVGTENVKSEVYEQRVIAETMISRPVMKRFKKRIREQGLLSVKEQAVFELDEELLGLSAVNK